MRSRCRTRLHHLLSLAVLAPLLGACVSRPALSLELDGATIYADTEPELAFASRIYESFPASIPPELELDFSIPVEVLIFSAAMTEDVEQPGFTTKYPLLVERRARLRSPAWPTFFGHELFHVYSLEALEGVPQIMVEGLADWFSTQSTAGYSESRTARWKRFLDERPSAQLHIRFTSSGYSTQSMEEIGSEPRFARSQWPSHEELIRLDPDEFNALEHFPKVAGYAIGFALVESLAGSHPEWMNPSDLRRREGETPAQYLERLELPSEDEVDQRAREVVSSSTPTRLYWIELRRSIAKLLRETGPKVANEQEFRAALLQVKIESEGQSFDLLQDPDFQRLLSEHCFLYFGAAE